MNAQGEGGGNIAATLVTVLFVGVFNPLAAAYALGRCWAVLIAPSTGVAVSARVWLGLAMFGMLFKLLLERRRDDAYVVAKGLGPALAEFALAWLLLFTVYLGQRWLP